MDDQSSRLLKEVDTLFHTTTKFEAIKSIVKNGFYPSYAEEFFAGRKQLVLMVSFSNIPLLESRSQINYGQYAIGLSRKWGVENKLHPVIYTFDGSEFSERIAATEVGAAFGQALDIFVEHGKVKVVSENATIKKYLELIDDNFTTTHAEKVKVISEDIFMAANYIRVHAKNYVVHQEGKKIIAFNDREWRYIPEKGLEDDPVLIFEGDKRFDYWKNKVIKPKPHGVSIPLAIKLEDIRYIVVNNDNEVEELYTYMEELHPKDAVYHAVKKGALKVYTMENLFHDF